jgi:hypothetical protein
MLLQATLEQSTYLAMVAYHFSTYLRTQNHRPDLQTVCLKIAHKLLVFTTWITWAQKMVPAAFALYWIGSSESCTLVLCLVRRTLTTA